MGAGIKDVAAAAGVSTATVSHVINNSRYVSDETRNKVLDIMDKLHYSPNYMAKSLKMHKSTVIGLIIPDISNFFFTEVASAVEKRLAASGFSLVLCNSNEDLSIEKQHIASLKSYMVNGIIIAPACRSYNYRALIQSADFPLVFIDRRLDEQQGDCVYVDTKTAVREAVEYLILKGHRKIGFIGGLKGLSTSDDRYEGYCEAMNGFGLEIDPDIVFFGDSRFNSGYDLCKKIVKESSKATALFVSNNLMGIGAMKYLVSNRIVIPDDLAIIALDDYNWAEVTNPALSTIRQPAGEMGEIAANLLLARMEKNHLEKFSNHVLKAELIIRQSC